MTLAMAPILTLAPTIEAVLPARLSVGQYHAMIESGILTADDSIELLEGCLVNKMPKNPLHSLSTCLILDSLLKLLPSGWLLRVQEPITLTDSEPEPDAAVVRGARRDYLARHPAPSEVALVIEVANTSLSLDRKWKKRLYATAGIPIYWVVNLPENVIESYSEPDSDDYQHQQVYRKADSVPVVIDGQTCGTIAAAELLP